MTWAEIETEIYKSFEGIALGNGIGFYEAEALCYFIEPHEPEYKIAKDKDERNDWKKLLPIIKDEECCFCFMDTKGLHFHLPAMLLTQKEEVILWLKKMA
jgi:hypothetical protein